MAINLSPFAIPSIANAVVTSIFPTLAADVVGVYTSDFTQVFKKARPIKAIIKEESKLPEHPLEDGTVVTDHMIILPVEIELSLFLNSVDYRNVYQEIKQLFLRGEQLSVQTKTSTYNKQVIQSISHDEDNSLGDIIALALKLKQWQVFSTEVTEFQPRDTTKSDNVERGVVQPDTSNIPEERQGTVANKIADYFGGI